jgi:prepilin peptidase CpaA
MLELWIPFAFTLVAAVSDWVRREIPDWIPAGMLLWALLGGTLGWLEVTWLQILLGVVFACVVTLPSFALGGIRGGDVKLLVALGAALGLNLFFCVLICILLAGGMYGLVAWMGGYREFAFGPAIALGMLGFAILAEVIRHAPTSP